MHFIYEYELCALIFLVLFSAFYFTRKKIPLVKNKLFGLMIIMCLISTFLDVLSAIIQNCNLNINIIFIYLINIFYMISQNALLLAFVYYLLVLVSNKSSISSYKFHWLLVPACILSLLIITTPFTRLIFFIENNNYMYGKIHWFLYLYVEVYLIICILIIVKNNKNIDKNHLYGIIGYLIISFLFQILQYNYPEYLLASLGTSIGIFLLFLTLQSPSDYIDKLTNLFNNDALYLSINDRFYKNQDFSLIIFTIQNYKNVCSLFGVDFGKNLVKETAFFLKTKYKYNNIFCYDNSNFAIILDSTNINKKDLSVEYKQFPISFDIKNLNIQSLPSIIGLNSSDFNDQDEMYTIIDHCLKEVRKTTDNILLFNSDGIKKIERKIKVINAINKAIINNSIDLVYQPIFDSKTKKIKCVEALARLTDDDMGYISPNEFIKIAEENDSIIKIGRLIFEKICIFLNTLSKENGKNIIVSVNLSVAECMEVDLVQNIDDTTSKYCISPNQIIFEITETYDSNSITVIKSTMDKLTKRGYQFALDDYGTRYSSLEYVIQLPFKYVKIDKSLLKACELSNKNCLLFISTIKAFHEMELIVVCEGVENEEQFNFLNNLLVENVQGYYFSKPLSSDKLLEYLIKN